MSELQSEVARMVATECETRVRKGFVERPAARYRVTAPTQRQVLRRTAIAQLLRQEGAHAHEGAIRAAASRSDAVQEVSRR